MNTILHDTWYELAGSFCTDKILQEQLYKEIMEAYADEGRAYHNSDHLVHMLEELQGVRDQIRSFETVLFSLFYHDIIYGISGSDNEKKSAELAVSRLGRLSVPKQVSDACYRQIMATKTHEQTRDRDTSYFTDADLAILGQPPEGYGKYCKKIRKEYGIYPDLLYKPGRKKVLEHFLNKVRIYHTDHFYSLYEENARRNLENELRMTS